MSYVQENPNAGKQKSINESIQSILVISNTVLNYLVDTNGILNRLAPAAKTPVLVEEVQPSNNSWDAASIEEKLCILQLKLSDIEKATIFVFNRLNDTI